MSTDTPTSTVVPLGRKVRFLSEKRGLRLIRRDQGEVFMPSGGVRAKPDEPEISYEFQNGWLEVRENQDILPDGLTDDGLPRERDAVAFLREHDWYGMTIHEVPRDATAPDPGELYGQIAALAAQRDVDGLIELGNAEAEEFGRESVLAAIKGAIREIDPSVLNEPPPEAA